MSRAACWPTRNALNILSARLAHLVEHGILERVDVGTEGERVEYRLTAKGEALLTVLTAMREWSDEWVFGRGNEPVIVRHRKTGRRIAKLRVTDAEGVPFTRRDLRAVPGPGASPETIRTLTRDETPPGRGRHPVPDTQSEPKR